MSELIEKRGAYSIIKDMIGLVRRDVLMDAYDALKNLPTVEPASPWRKVDEPPKENGRYLVSWEGVVTTDEYKNGVWLYASMFNQRVTHWMPLPEPPKEDADANK